MQTLPNYRLVMTGVVLLGSLIHLSAWSEGSSNDAVVLKERDVRPLCCSLPSVSQPRGPKHIGMNRHLTQTRWGCPTFVLSPSRPR